MLRPALHAVARRLPDRAGRQLSRLVDDDLELLVGAFMIVAGLLTFLVVANVVGSGHARTFDERIMLALRNPDDLGDPIGPHWLESAVRDLTSLGSYIVLTLLSLFVIAFFMIRRQYHASFLVVLTSMGGALLMQQLKVLFGRPRPELVPHLVDVSSLSFPSGHALSAATVYLTLAALLSRLVRERRLKVYVVAVAFVLVFLVGSSRVYLGVHWPTDVVAGWAVGLAWSVMCWLLTSQLQRRGAVEQPEETSEEASARKEAQS